MEQISATQAFRLYRQSSNVSPISYERFRAFWQGIKTRDQSWWLQSFEAGKVDLTEHAVENLESEFERVRREGVDQELISKIRKYAPELCI